MRPELLIGAGSALLFCISAYAYVYRHWPRPPRRIREHLLVRQLRREMDNHL